MHLSNPYSFFLFFSAAVAFITAIITWRRRSAPGAFPLFLMLATTVIWSGANALFLEAKDPGWRVFWFDAMLFGAVMSAPAFWAFSVQFTERAHWLTRRSIALVCLIPILAVLLGWTTESHGIYYEVRNLEALAKGESGLVPGAFYWIYIAYAYSAVVFALWLVARAFFQAPKAYRGQAGTILAGTLIPFIGSIVHTLAIRSGSAGVDPTPLLFTVMGVFYAYGLFWYRLFDLVPVARYALVEHMQDGVIVLDTRDRIVDANPSALRRLDWNRRLPVGRHVRELMQRWFEQIEEFPPHLYVQTEVSSSKDPETFFDLRVEPLTDRHNTPTGRLIVFRDITRQKRAERALIEAHDRLKLHLKEIEMLQQELRQQAIRDPLTNLFNRRYLEETLDRELARAAREGAPIGVCMADIDGFKSFNDRHGHHAGDFILKKLAEIFIANSRAEDVACRYGGEEFLILLPGADLYTTMLRAEKWRSAFAGAGFDFDGKLLFGTLSLGVAVFPSQAQTGEELLKLADEALYLSKRNGRNQVSAAKPLGQVIQPPPEGSVNN